MADEAGFTLKDAFGVAPAVATLLSGLMSIQGGQDAAKGQRQAGDSALAAGERAAVAAEDAGARIAESEVIKASRAKQAKTFEAEQLEQKAGLVAALSQRNATEERRQANLVQSRAIAVAAASGAGARDPSVVHLVSRIAGEGTYRANVALFQGEEQARVLRMSAAAKNYEGLTVEESGSLNAADALAKWKATAEAERAKAKATKEAADIGADTALNRGNIGAAQTLLPLGASLLEKYGDKLFGNTPKLDSEGRIINPTGMGGSARDSGVDMTEEEAAAADEAFKLDPEAEKAYADQKAAEAWAKDQAYGDEFTQDGWTVDPSVEWNSAAPDNWIVDPAVEWASAVNDGFEAVSAVDAAADFEWLAYFI